MNVDQENADLRRRLQITEQSLLDTQAELGQVRPPSDALHRWAAAYLDSEVDMVEVRGAEADMLAAHRATTPSQTPPTHVIVAVDELNALREIADAAGEYVLATRDFEGVLFSLLRNAVDAYRSGAS